MKKIVLLLPLILFSLISNSKGQALSVEAFDNAVTGDSNYQLLDVRTPEEFDEMHIPNAINNNYNDEHFMDRLKHMDKSKPVYIYCLSGGRSAAAQQVLLKEGFIAVYNLDGGIRKWEALNKPIVSSSKAEKKGMTFNEFKQLLENKEFILVDFNAKWCPPCRKMAPFIERLTVELKEEVLVMPINIETNKELASHYKVETLPLLILFKDKKVVWEHSGFISETDLRQVLKTHTN